MILEGLLNKTLSFLAREAVPFILSVIVRNGLNKMKKREPEK